jgi:hypothetical protein
MTLGLIGKTDSAALRAIRSARYFHIGNGSAKTILHRLNCLQATYEQLKEAAEQ